MEEEEGYFEGCGREGPIRSIFLCEFHPIAGPKITCQVPEDYVSKEVFDAVSVYIIPKHQLQRCVLTVNVLGYKITGFPIRIDNPKYARNAFYFNLCFVCDAWARTVQYEPVVKKLSEYLITMEFENGFLSRPKQTEADRARLPAILKQVIHDLNLQRMCTVVEGTTTMHLKVVNIKPDPPTVQDHHVPVFIVNKHSFRGDQWDLTTQQVLPYINGFTHVAKIAAQADVDNNLVKACVQNLVYYGVVYLAPIFLYTNVYVPTPKLRNLAEDSALQESCLKYVAISGRDRPSLRDVFLVYSRMTHGKTVKDICIQLNPHAMKINERKLIQFGLLHEFIRRVQRYPIYVEDEAHPTRPSPLQCHFTGYCSFDEVCCNTGFTNQQLEDHVETDPDVLVIWK